MVQSLCGSLHWTMQDTPYSDLPCHVLESQVKSSLSYLTAPSLCNWPLLLFQERFLTVVPALHLLLKHVGTLCGRMLSEGAGPVGALFQTTALFLALPGAGEQHEVDCGKSS